VTVSQQTIDAILNPKIRKRELHIPIRHAKLPRKGSRRAHKTNAKGGTSLRCCPLRKGGVYRLEPPIPRDHYLQISNRQPTRARAMLRYWDLCDRHPRKPITITVWLDPIREGNEWLVFFALGDHREAFDRAVYLAKYGDYTMTASKQAVAGDPEVLMPFACDLAAARKHALEKRISPQQQALDRIRADTDTLLAAMKALKDRNRLKLIRREIDKLAAKLSAEESAMLQPSVCAESQRPVAVQDGPRPNSTEPLVSLETAA
jgi:hypothetical protein